MDQFTNILEVLYWKVIDYKVVFVELELPSCINN